ncbi:EAL domain-containing protein [Glycocaulis profundi]|nr:EAL domain-containing protein [Glycocaulis profundi]
MPHQSNAATGSDAILTAMNRSLAMIEFDPQGDVLAANENFLDLMGYEAGELVGRNHRLLVDPAYALSEGYAEFWRRLRAGDFFVDEVRRIGRGGRQVWIQASYNPVFDSEGAVAKVVKFATDITGRVRAVSEIGAGLGCLAEDDLNCEITAPFIPSLDALRTDFNNSVTALKTARSDASHALNHMSNGLVMVRPDGRIGLYNKRVLELFAVGPEALGIGMPLAEYLSHVGGVCGWDAARLERVIANHRLWMAKDAITRVEHHFDDGKILSISCRPLPGGGAILTYDDVTEAREGQRRITHMAFHDALTGLANRRGFSDRLDELAADGGFAMVMIDLDRFKQVNDTLGHAVGDRVLKEAARRLRELCSPDEPPFRLGGDELAALTTLEPVAARDLADRIVAAMTAPFFIDEQAISIGASAGLAFAAPGDDPGLVQRKADLALYEAKQKGRQRVETYREGMIEAAERRRETEAELAAAIVHDQFELHFQPLYSLPGRELSGFEALLRWRHPERGLVPPSDFIPLAEQNGMIEPIGAWVIEEACRQAAAWPGDLYVSINVSPVQLRSADILRRLTGALDRNGLLPRRVEIEITETALVEDSGRIAAALAGLRALGVRIAMDDFGTGYSSLAHLREFELDRIKIDRSFIGACPSDTGSAAVVRAVATMARDLGIATTGEGVENEAQLANLVALGCGTAQGFLLGRPLSADAALALSAGGGIALAEKAG